MTDAERLLGQWLKRVRESQLAHYAAATKASTLHLLIGLPAAAFSAIIGTTVFVTLDSNSSNLDIKYRVAIALISIITAILTGCQTFLRFSDKVDAHRASAAKYSAVRRLIEQHLTFPNKISEIELEELRKKINEISETAPAVSSSTWKRAMERVGTVYLYSDRSTEK